MTGSTRQRPTLVVGGTGQTGRPVVKRLTGRERAARDAADAARAAGGTGIRTPGGTA